MQLAKPRFTPTPQETDENRQTVIDLNTTRKTDFFCFVLFKLVILLMAISFNIASPSASHALNLEKFMMPGPLSSVHAKFEEKCANCHDPLHKTKHRKKCLSCHKDVASDFHNNTGFHGKNNEVKNNKCLHCHTEHKGRDANIILMDLDNFDHSKTDFSLKESHQKLACSKCHHNKIKFRDTSTKCYDCHAAIAPHRGGLGKECETCHQETSWQNFSFNHKQTKYPLEGPHANLRCLNCHANQRWLGLSQKCVDCHKINDVHAGSFGDKCDKCHIPFVTSTGESGIDNQSAINTWKKVIFNHDNETFKLTGKHRKVSCEKCHTIKQKIASCFTCHQKDDAHKSRFGQKCENCHTANDWQKVIFRHDSTTFKLTGKHKKVSCKKCHTNKRKTATCFICHEGDDTHKSRFGKKCDHCHTSKAWKEVIFNHNQTKFPLTYSHTKVDCRKCHTGRVQEQKLSLNCVACHQLDDKHKGALGQHCETCHTSVAWKSTEFSHTTTKFPLTNKHSQIPCLKCHFAKAETNKIDSSCIACHLKNDAHKGQQGKQCDKCHNTKGWHTELFFDHDLTNFPLLGMHILPPCEACHLSNTFKDTDSSCKNCHKNNDIHKGSMGENCFNCHNPNGWKIWSFNHDKKTSFKLTGKHLELSCAACHTEPISAKNKLPHKCSACHVQHDAHRGKFGQFCGRCHITESFKELRISK